MHACCWVVVDCSQLWYTRRFESAKVQKWQEGWKDLAVKQQMWLEEVAIDFSWHEGWIKMFALDFLYHAKKVMRLYGLLYVKHLRENLNHLARYEMFPMEEQRML